MFKRRDLIHNNKILRCSSFIESIRLKEKAGYSSVVNGYQTLYGTVYGLFSQYYIGSPINIDLETKNFIINCQVKTGQFIGPELRDYNPPKNIKHTLEHLLHHSTCTTIPFCIQFNIPIKYKLKFAHKYCDVKYLTEWLNKRDFSQAWLEGNNFLFVGQLLIYLRDIEKHPKAADALKIWFDWLDKTVDVNTGLWGTNGFCKPAEAVYGGYHQLLVYYYENHPLPNIKGIVDTVLSLQHPDGGFNPKGNGGACEDVDSVDILVNCYKRLNYRRVEIRHSLRRCLKHILATQNSDGGFPYNRNQKQTHMGIPGTEAGPNVSCTFPTWFRIHTLALIAQIIPNEPVLYGIPFQFNQTFSMGWHDNLFPWEPPSDRICFKERILSVRDGFRKLRCWNNKISMLLKNIIRSLTTCNL